MNLMLNELIAGDLFKNIQGRKFENIKNIKDVFEKVKLLKFYVWIKTKKPKKTKQKPAHLMN